LPGGANIRKLVDWVRTYLGFELEWDLQLALLSREAPLSRLGRYGQLGWTSWMGRAPKPVDAEDLVLDAEAVLARSRPGTTQR
jgi:type VI secretion system protein ImpH